VPISHFPTLVRSSTRSGPSREVNKRSDLTYAKFFSKCELLHTYRPISKLLCRSSRDGPYTEQCWLK
jgi:hypothetical protein